MDALCAGTAESGAAAGRACRNRPAGGAGTACAANAGPRRSGQMRARGPQSAR